METSSIVDKSTNIVSKLNNNDLVGQTALVAGIIWSQKDLSNIVRFPISSTFNGLLYGSLCSIGASFVADKLPEKAKPYFAGLIGVSAGLYLIQNIYNKITNKSETENKDNNNLPNIENIDFCGQPFITIRRNF